MERFYSDMPIWYEKIGNIYALLERAKITEEQSSDKLELRKLNRVVSVHASTAIEGNRLSVSQVLDIINGKTVYGPPKDIKEIQNAWGAYEILGDYEPYSVESFLFAHSKITNTLIDESGTFRTVGVQVVNGFGEVLHRGTDFHDVPAKISELFDWARDSEAHSLIKSSAVHFMIEYIHPFRDGNGRMGRLWQTLMLSRWNEMFAWIPVETLIHNSQAGYYKALQESHDGHVDASPFISFMLDVIENALFKYQSIATETIESEDVGINAGNVGIKVGDVGINHGNKKQQELVDAIIVLLKRDSRITTAVLAEKLNLSQRQIERILRKLRESGRIRREGSRKAGHWIVN
jgi:Fic family protein